MKQKIAVLFGGCSPEYEVSLQSAYAVIRHMDRSRYEPLPVGITREGDWFLYTGCPEQIPADAWHGRDCLPVAVSPSRRDRALLILRDSGWEKCPIDAAFPVLHGCNGEDGTVQGLFALAGIPLVGCGVLASALCMDKDRAHRLVRDAGVAVPASFVLSRGAALEEAQAHSAELGYPLFIKPLRTGSSLGITRVESSRQLPAALRLAFSYDSQILVEEAIPGFEVGCAVLGNEALTVGGPDEIELAEGFFDFTEKYTLKTSAIHIPARIPADQAEAVRQTALVVYRALGCRGFARVDLFLEPGGRLVFNEVNTIPGFTAHSRYPGMMQAAGIPFPQLISRLIELGVEG